MRTHPVQEGRDAGLGVVLKSVHVNESHLLSW